MSIDSANNFIAGTGLIANSNLLQQKFDKAADVVKNSGSVKDQKAAAEKFESMFIGQMMKMMFDTVPTDENFGGGFAEDTMKGFLTDEYANLITKGGGIGIAKQLQQAVFDPNTPKANTIEATKAYSKVYNF